MMVPAILPSSLALPRFQVRSRWFASALAASALALIVRVLAGPLIIDDAYITYRYALNLAAGNGFVYNLGERILGTSTQLFAVLLAIAARVGFDPISSSVFLGIVGDLVSIGALCYLATKWGSWPLGLIVSLWIGLDPRLIRSSVSGMETEFYASLILAALAAYVAGRSGAALALATAAALTRPEGGCFWLPFSS